MKSEEGLILERKVSGEKDRKVHCRGLVGKVLENKGFS